MIKPSLLPEILLLQQEQFHFFSRYHLRVLAHCEDKLISGVPPTLLTEYGEQFRLLEESLSPEAPDFNAALKHLQHFVCSAEKMMTTGDPDKDLPAAHIIAVSELAGAGKMLSFTLNLLDSVAIPVPALDTTELIETMGALRRHFYQLPSEEDPTTDVPSNTGSPEWLQIVDHALQWFQATEGRAQAPELAVITRALSSRLSVLAFSTDLKLRDLFLACLAASEAIRGRLPEHLISLAPSDGTKGDRVRFAATMNQAVGASRGVADFSSALASALDKREGPDHRPRAVPQKVASVPRAPERSPGMAAAMEMGGGSGSGDDSNATARAQFSSSSWATTSQMLEMALEWLDREDEEGLPAARLVIGRLAFDHLRKVFPSIISADFEAAFTTAANEAWHAMAKVDQENINTMVPELLFSYCRDYVGYQLGVMGPEEDELTGPYSVRAGYLANISCMFEDYFQGGAFDDVKERDLAAEALLDLMFSSPNSNAVMAKRIRTTRAGWAVAATPMDERVQLCREAMGIAGPADVPHHDPDRRALQLREAGRMGVRFALRPEEAWNLIKDWNSRLPTPHLERDLSLSLEQATSEIRATQWGAHLVTQRTPGTLERDEVVAAEPVRLAVAASLSDVLEDSGPHSFDVWGFAYDLPLPDAFSIGSWADTVRHYRLGRAVAPTSTPPALNERLPEGHPYKDWRVPSNTWEKMVQESFDPWKVQDLGLAVAHTILAAARSAEARLQLDETICYRLISRSPGAGGKTTLAQVMRGTVARIRSYYDPEHANHNENFGIGTMEAAVGFSNVLSPVSDESTGKPYQVLWLEPSNDDQARWDRLHQLWDTAAEAVRTCAKQVRRIYGVDTQACGLDGVSTWLDQATGVYAESRMWFALAPDARRESVAPPRFPVGSSHASELNTHQANLRLFAVDHPGSGALELCAVTSNLYTELFQLDAEIQSGHPVAADTAALYAHHGHIVCNYQGQRVPRFHVSVDPEDVIRWAVPYMKEIVARADENAYFNKLAQAGQRLEHYLSAPSAEEASS